MRAIRAAPASWIARSPRHDRLVQSQDRQRHNHYVAHGMPTVSISLVRGSGATRGDRPGLWMGRRDMTVYETKLRGAANRITLAAAFAPSQETREELQIMFARLT